MKLIFIKPEMNLEMKGTCKRGYDFHKPKLISVHDKEKGERLCGGICLGNRKILTVGAIVPKSVNVIYGGGMRSPAEVTASSRVGWAILTASLAPKNETMRPLRQKLTKGKFVYVTSHYGGGVDDRVFFSTLMRDSETKFMRYVKEKKKDPHIGWSSTVSGNIVYTRTGADIIGMVLGYTAVEKKPTQELVCVCINDVLDYLEVSK